MKTIIIHHRSPHHAVNSGYGILAGYLDAQIIYGNIKFPYRIAKLAAKFYSKNKGIFNVSSVLKFIELYQLLIRIKGQKSIVHFLNGERDIRHLGFLKRRFPNTYFCATFHKPPEILKKSIKNVSTLSKLDGVIAVGPNQVDFIKNWLNIDLVKFIPHGIDTNFFSPENNKREEKTLLFVGQHLRDFKTFNYCIPKIAEKTPGLKVNVILHSSYKKYIEVHKTVNVFSKVYDMELKKYYQTATALFLPMLNSTACNSILEAMAMGLPIISSDVGGNYGYLDNDNAILAPKGDDDFLIDATVDLLKNEDKINKMSLMSLEVSKQFDWFNVAKQVNDFYSYFAIN